MANSVGVGAKMISSGCAFPAYKIVSADSHLNEPPGLFKDVPQSLRQLAPQLIKTEKGDAWILAPGGEPRYIGTSAVAGRKKEEYLSKPVTFDTMRRGSFEQRK